MNIWDKVIWEKTNFYCIIIKGSSSTQFSHRNGIWKEPDFRAPSTKWILLKCLQTGYIKFDKIDKKEVDGEKVKSDPCSGLDSESMSNVGELPDG